MKKILFFVALFNLLLGGVVFAQDKKASSSMESTDDEEADPDDENLGAVKIMIIPYNPSYYKFDVDKDINKKYSDKKKSEVKAWYSFGLDENISARIVNSDESDKKSALSDYSGDAESDLNLIYSSIEYAYAKRDRKKAAKNEKLIGNLMGKMDKSEKSNDVKYESDKKHDEYMNVTMKDPTLLPRLAKKYGTQLFVFINQFEISTNYKKCVDPINKIYERQIKIHFSVFDAEGNQLYGDLASLTFPSFSKDIDDVIVKRFPVVANYVAEPPAPAGGQ
jgi:hypothetical protein